MSIPCPSVAASDAEPPVSRWDTCCVLAAAPSAFTRVRKTTGGSRSGSVLLSEGVLFISYYTYIPFF